MSSDENVKEVHFTENDLEEIQEIIDDMSDISELLPNEDFEEFIEHEDLD